MKAILTTEELIAEHVADLERRMTLPREIAEVDRTDPNRRPIRFEDLKISGLRDGRMTVAAFDLLPIQRRIRDLIASIRADMAAGRRPRGRVRIVVLKARQMGASTEIEKQLFELVVNNPHASALIIAHVEKSAMHLYRISRRFYDHLPVSIRPPRKASTARGIAFDEPHESDLGIEVVGEGAGRSRTLAGFHGSEVALWTGNADDALAAVRGCLMNEPWCLEVLESTGYGLGGTFHREFKAAKDDGRAIFSPWFEDPRYRTRPAITLDDVRRMGGEREAIEHIEQTCERFLRVVPVPEGDSRNTEGMPVGTGLVPDVRSTSGLDGEQLAWLAQKLLGEYGGDVRRFKREFPATEEEAFTGDARQVFSEAIIQRVDSAIATVAGNASRDLVSVLQRAPGCHLVRAIREDGGPDSAYVIGADPAEGLEHGDDSALCVIDRVRRRVCACARTGLDPDEFAQLIAALGRYYNGAWINVELNNHGYAVLMQLRKLGYGRLWRETQREAVNEKSISNLGYRTTAGSKARAVGSLIENVRSGLAIPFPEIREQMVTFVRDERGRMGAVPGCKDDLVSAAWLAAIAADELGISDPITEKQRELALTPNPSRDPLAKGIALGTLNEVLQAGGGNGLHFALDGGGFAEESIGSELRRSR